MHTGNIRWGILSTGRISHRFAEAIAFLPDAEVIAVGSRAMDTARRFADEYRIPRAYASYEALAADPDVDAVYVSTPHPMHKECSLLCLSAGKAVLCEKPFTLNAAEAETVVLAARAKGVFLMEAMWTRFLPSIAKVRELIAGGAIGEPRMVMADFGFRAGFDPHSRIFDPHLGGGGLLAGVGSVMRALKPGVRVIAAEPETASPLATSLARGEASYFEGWTASFVDGAGGKSVLPSMWPLLRTLVDDSVVMPLSEVTAAMRYAADRVHVIAEGAAGCAIAAARSGRAGRGKIVAVVSGGNIDLSRFAELVGATPPPG